MTAIIAYAHANMYWLVPVLLVVLSSIANGLINHPEAATVLHKLVDALSLVTNKDSPGTFKLPLVMASKDPAAMEMPVPK